MSKNIFEKSKIVLAMFGKSDILYDMQPRLQKVQALSETISRIRAPSGLHFGKAFSPSDILSGLMEFLCPLTASLSRLMVSGGNVRLSPAVLVCLESGWRCRVCFGFVIISSTLSVSASPVIISEFSSCWLDTYDPNDSETLWDFDTNGVVDFRDFALLSKLDPNNLDGWILMSAIGRDPNTKVTWKIELNNPDCIPYSVQFYDMPDGLRSIYDPVDPNRCFWIGLIPTQAGVFYSIKFELLPAQRKYLLILYCR